MGIKKSTRSVKQTVLIYSIGAVFCIYIGLLCGASVIPGQGADEFLNSFYNFVIKSHHYIVGVNEYTFTFVMGFLIAWSLGFILIFTKIEHPFAGEEYGRASWGDAKAFTREYANHDEKNVIEVNTGDVKLQAPLKVNTGNYWLAEDVYLSIDNKKTSNLNILVVGPPGSGKSFRLARPLLSQLCGNFLVTDPKGELYKQTGQYFEDNGYEVMVMNVESEDAMPLSIHFNPFEYIRNESDIMSIAAILMKATTPAEESSNTDQFFEQSAEVLLTSIIYLIHYYYPKSEQNWATFVKLLDATCVYTQKNGAIDNSRSDGILNIAKRAQATWKKDHDSDFPGYVNIEKYYNGAAETTSSIVATLDAHCRYMKLKCVVDLLSEDEIKIKESFGYSKKSSKSSTGKRILYIVTSEDKRYYDWIPSMVYSLFFDELYHLTAIDPSLHETLPQHLTFLMDEFANVTLPDSFVEKLSTMRSRNMSAVIIVQNLIQLKRKFPKFDMDKDLIGNCSIIDILGAPDMDSCEYLAKHFGTQTIHKASDSDSKDHKGSSSRSEDVMQKSLLSAEDIFAMNKDGECAIVVKGAKPLYQMKCRMEKTAFVKLLCRKENPYNLEKRIKERKKRKASNNETYLLVGNKARKKAEALKSDGVPVIRLTMDDMGLLKKAISIDDKSATLPVTDEQKKMMEENYERYKRNHRGRQEVDYEAFRDKTISREEDLVGFRKRTKVVRQLYNKGFSNGQLLSMRSLIMDGYETDEILSLFDISSSSEEIENYMKIVS